MRKEKDASVSYTRIPFLFVIDLLDCAAACNQIDYENDQSHQQQQMNQIAANG